MIGVGIIGASPQGSWGSQAHIPAVQSLSGMRVAAVATSRLETARQTAERFQIPLAFDDAFKLASHPDVDLVTIAVRVPEHDRLVRAALAAGKAVYCEWPLAVDTAQAEGLLAAADSAGVRHVVGLQSRVAPIVNHLKRLVSTGYIGDLVATTMIHSGPWLTAMPSNMIYLQEMASGGNFFTIRAGHSLDALCYALGEFTELTATLATQIRTVRVSDTGSTATRTTPDQMAVTGRLVSGAVASVHMQGGPARGAGLHWEISGTKRDLLVTAPSGTTGIQMTPNLSLAEVSENGTLVPLQVAADLAWVETPPGPAFNVAQLYARYRDGLPVPNFATAVRHHRLLDSIRAAATTGQRETL
jgi:predicted dehydrogenase